MPKIENLVWLTKQCKKKYIFLVDGLIFGLKGFKKF